MYKVKRNLVCVLALWLICLSNSFELMIPVKTETLFKVNYSINKLYDALQNLGTECQNKMKMWKRVVLTREYLLELNQEFAQYNNVILGGANYVDGDKNIIIGNYNSVQGSNNWVFVSDFLGEIEGDLLIGDWRVEIDRAKLILINPRMAISFINEGKNEELAQKYLSQERMFFKFKGELTEYDEIESQVLHKLTRRTDRLYDQISN